MNPLTKTVSHCWHLRLLWPWCIGLLTACSALQQTERLSQKITTEQQQGESLLHSLQQRPQRQRITLHNKPWISPKALTLPTIRLPETMNRDITLATGAPVPLSELSKLIHKICGLSLRLTPDAETKLQQRSKNQPTPYDEPTVAGIRWQGKLEGLLDEIASTLGLSWRYQHAVITLYYLDSRTFQIYAIPSKIEMSSTIHSGIDVGLGGNDSASKGSGQSSQRTGVSLKSDMLEDIYRSLQSMLTPGVGQLSRSPSTGGVTVTDTPAVLDHIAHYIDYENRTITKQVLLNIKVLAIELHDEHQLGINWNLLYNPTHSGRSLLGGLELSPGNQSSIGNATIFKLLGSGKLGQSEWLLNALAKQGKVSTITSPSVTTLNLQPVPVQVATQKSYLARTETTQKAKGDITLTLTPGMITHGFNMHLLPFVMADDQLLLQYTINLSELIDTKNFGIKGKAEIQLPEINSRLFSQKVKLHSGDTLVLSGFEQIHQQADRKGTGSPSNWLLGGGVRAHQKRSLIVLMITPTVLT
jgi:type IVB pilus formation R64 PilN family outer membrane protein